MTRKQLESIIRFSSVFNDPANDISVVNEQFGLSLTEATSPSQAVTAYLEAKGIRLEGEAEVNPIYISQLKDLQDTTDTEMAHIEADNILCNILLELGRQDVVEEYGKIKKWYA